MVFSLLVGFALLSWTAWLAGQTTADSARLLAAQADSAAKRQTEFELRRAIGLHLQAAELYRRSGQRGEEAAMVIAVGRVYATGLGRSDSALTFYRRALQMAREAGDRRREGIALSNVGAAYRELGRPDSALAYYRQALLIAREVGDTLGEYDVLNGVGSVYLETTSPRLRDPVRAAAYFDSAAALAAAVGAHTGGDPNAVSFAERVHRTQDTYARWARAWLARSSEVGAPASVKGALAAAERGRAQALLDLMRRSSQPTEDAVGVRERLARPRADLVAEAESLAAPLRRAQAAALTFLVTDDTLITWLVLPSGDIRVARAVVRRDTIGSLVRTLRTGLGVEGMGAGAGRASARAVLATDYGPLAGVQRRVTSDTRVRATLATLTRLLLPSDLDAELARQLPASGDLVIVPYSALALVPFGVLSTGPSGEPLGMRFAVRFAPSLAALQVAEARPERISNRRLLGREREQALAHALVVGNPTMPRAPGASRRSAALEALPSAEREAHWVARRLGAKPLIGSAATEAVVAARLPQASLVHLATHGIAYNSDAKVRDSFVALAPDSMNDGLLTVGEVLDDPALRLTADLVVLSACQTGLGHLREAEGTVGLQRAFLAKGARSVLVSLWSVSDEATELLMRRFYTHWLDDRDAPSRAEALRRAQGDVRATRGFEDPRYWAAFQLVGAG